MRITNNMMMNNYLSSLNGNLTSVTDYQKQVSTGKAINALSDDPVALISIMNCNIKLNRNTQHELIVESGLTWLDQTDTSVYELNQVLQSAYENVLEVANDDLTPEDKLASAEYIAQLRDQVLTIANGQSSDKYLFGGYNVDTKPFTVDSSGTIFYNGLDLTDEANPALIAAGSQSITYEIGAGIAMGISITGPELLGTGEDNIYSVMDSLYNALVNDASASELGQYIAKLQGCQSNVLTTEATVGGMINRLELLQDRYEQEDLTFKELKSNVEDVDIAEAYMNYSMAQTVYSAALQVGTQVIQASILDYLK
jgi:flagellar hook-associated protein 3 FlgL